MQNDNAVGSPEMDPEKRLRRTSGILKALKPRNPFTEVDFTEPTPDVTLTRSRRVSFAANNFVKPFSTHSDELTSWDVTYEEEMHHTDSTVSSQEHIVECRTLDTLNTSSITCTVYEEPCILKYNKPTKIDIDKIYTCDEENQESVKSSIPVDIPAKAILLDKENLNPIINDISVISNRESLKLYSKQIKVKSEENISYVNITENVLKEDRVDNKEKNSGQINLNEFEVSQKPLGIFDAPANIKIAIDKNLKNALDESNSDEFTIKFNELENEIQINKCYEEVTTNDKKNHRQTILFNQSMELTTNIPDINPHLGREINEDNKRRTIHFNDSMADLEFTGKLPYLDADKQDMEITKDLSVAGNGVVKLGTTEYFGRNTIFFNQSEDNMDETKLTENKPQDKIGDISYYQNENIKQKTYNFNNSEGDMEFTVPLIQTDPSIHVNVSPDDMTNLPDKSQIKIQNKIRSTDDPPVCNSIINKENRKTILFNQFQDNMEFTMNISAGIESTNKINEIVLEKSQISRIETKNIETNYFNESMEITSNLQAWNTSSGNTSIYHNEPKIGIVTTDMCSMKENGKTVLFDESEGNMEFTVNLPIITKNVDAVETKNCNNNMFLKDNTESMEKTLGNQLQECVATVLPVIELNGKTMIFNQSEGDMEFTVNLPVLANDFVTRETRKGSKKDDVVKNNLFQIPEIKISESNAIEINTHTGNEHTYENKPKEDIATGISAMKESRKTIRFNQSQDDMEFTIGLPSITVNTERTEHNKNEFQDVTVPHYKNYVDQINSTSNIVGNSADVHLKNKTIILEQFKTEICKIPNTPEKLLEINNEQVCFSKSVSNSPQMLTSSDPIPLFNNTSRVNNANKLFKSKFESITLKHQFLQDSVQELPNNNENLSLIYKDVAANTIKANQNVGNYKEINDVPEHNIESRRSPKCASENRDIFSKSSFFQNMKIVELPKMENTHPNSSKKNPHLSNCSRSISHSLSKHSQFENNLTKNTSNLSENLSNIIYSEPMKVKVVTSELQSIAEHHSDLLLQSFKDDKTINLNTDAKTPFTSFHMSISSNNNSHSIEDTQHFINARISEPVSEYFKNQSLGDDNKKVDVCNASMESSQLVSKMHMSAKITEKKSNEDKQTVNECNASNGSNNYVSKIDNTLPSIGNKTYVLDNSRANLYKTHVIHKSIMLSDEEPLNQPTLETTGAFLSIPIRSQLKRPSLENIDEKVACKKNNLNLSLKEMYDDLEPMDVSMGALYITPKKENVTNADQKLLTQNKEENNSLLEDESCQLASILNVSVEMEELCISPQKKENPVYEDEHNVTENYDKSLRIETSSVLLNKVRENLINYNIIDTSSILAEIKSIQREQRKLENFILKNKIMQVCKLPILDIPDIQEIYLVESLYESKEVSSAGGLETVNEKPLSMDGIELCQPPKSLIEKIKEMEERCNANWKFEKCTNSQYEFYTLNKTLTFIIDTESEHTYVSNIETNINIEDDADPICFFILKVFRDKLKKENLVTTLGSKYDIMSLLDYVDMTKTELILKHIDFQEITLKYFLEISKTDHMFSFKILNRKLLIFWVITVDMSNVNSITPDSITAKTVCGEPVNENQIKELCTSCPKGLNFLKVFITKIEEHISNISKRILFRRRKQ